MLASRNTNAIDAAEAFVSETFPDAAVALLAGSVTRGEATTTSDLDIVLVTERPEAPYRESFRAFGWPIETFVYTETTYPAWFAQDAARRRPSLPRMCAEGIVLKDRNGLAAQVQAEARALLAKGPEPLNPQELAWARYQISDLLDDLGGARNGTEMLFTALALAPALADLACDLQRQWRGAAKWVPRALEPVGARLATRLADVVRNAGAGHPSDLIELGDEILDSCGGRLFEGFSMGKNEAPGR